MSFVPTPTVDQATGAARPLLAAVGKRLGTVPNLFRIVANSPAAPEAYIGFSDALGKGVLSAPTRERIALAVAEVNGCDYCLSTHAYLARNVVKLDDAEITANHSGASNDIKADAAIRFAAKLVRKRGQVSEAEVAAVKRAGYSDAEVIEIIAHVALNVFTNIINEALKTEIDFPRIAARKSAQSPQPLRRNNAGVTPRARGPSLASSTQGDCHVRSFQHRRSRRPEALLPRGGRAPPAGRAAAARFPERQPYVPRSDPGACRTVIMSWPRTSRASA